MSVTCRLFQKGSDPLKSFHDSRHFAQILAHSGRGLTPFGTAKRLLKELEEVFPSRDVVVAGGLGNDGRFAWVHDLGFAGIASCPSCNVADERHLFTIVSQSQAFQVVAIFQEAGLFAPNSVLMYTYKPEGDMASAELIRELKEKLRRWEGMERGGAARAGVFSSGLVELDRLLPQGGLSPGTLLEWLSAGEGAGAAALTLFLAARVQAQGGALVVIDERREFYPPAAAERGIDLDRTVVVQPAQSRDALWAWEQALRSPAVGAVWGWLERLADRSFRRLQLAAEVGGSVGLLLRPESCRREASWAEARLLVTPVGVARRAEITGRRLHLELLHGRGGIGGGAVIVELHHETRDVPVAAAVADPAAARRTARAGNVG